MNSNHLLVCNAYPSENDVYQNGFIHRRVKSYLKYNLTVDIFCLNNANESLSTDYYEGVRVYRGSLSQYEEFLSIKQYDSYLIHFITRQKYEPIVNNIKNPKIIVWIHGAEAEDWHRRWFEFLSSKKKLQTTLYLTNQYYPRKMEFLNKIYTQTEIDLTFIYVSKWFKENIADVDAKASPEKYEIIPNIIDGSLFNFEKKPATQRFRVLSIRPFASMKYANDLTVEAILELSKRPYFNKLEFCIYGNGPSFDSTLRPIKNISNVKIFNKFLTQNEISEIHKEFGLFICPTRLDSQGVSMCEAMSSGLVPISTNISAIPEFVEHNITGLLAKPESGISLANQIEKLYFDAKLFERLSENAAKSIREIADENIVIPKELDVIQNANSN